MQGPVCILETSRCNMNSFKFDDLLDKLERKYGPTYYGNKYHRAYLNLIDFLWMLKVRI